MTCNVAFFDLSFIIPLCTPACGYLNIRYHWSCFVHMINGWLNTLDAFQQAAVPNTGEVFRVLGYTDTSLFYSHCFRLRNNSMCVIMTVIT